MPPPLLKVSARRSPFRGIAVSHLAYAVEAADLRTVIVDGRIVMRDRVLTTADEREIRRRVRALAIGIGSFRGSASS